MVCEIFFCSNFPDFVVGSPKFFILQETETLKKLVILGNGSPPSHPKKISYFRRYIFFDYHATKIFTEYLLAIEMKITKIFLNKPVHLGVSIPQLSQILMCEFWFDYIKPKFGKKGKLCHMDTDSFIIYIKQMISTKIFQEMLKQDLTLQIKN